MRRCYARERLVDQFPVFGEDGFSKVGGLGPDAFRITLYRDAELASAAVDTTEIPGSPGEYRLGFTPDAAGIWEVEIAYVAGRQVYAEQYEVIEPVVVGSSRPPGQG
ncbi:MAG: hypothetical protein KC619_25270 [Myxococcales bacterium]|nr:hypothetical protein [Myxococcales bacterium]